MKELISITNKDVIEAINCIHPLTKNNIVSRSGILGLSFEESYKKHGSCYIEIERVSHDIVFKSILQFSYNSVWFAEYSSDGDCSNYNKNHFFGYLKLQELGYKLPDEPQW